MSAQRDDRQPESDAVTLAAEALQRQPLFRTLPADERRHLAAQFDLLHVTAGTDIIVTGQSGHGLHLLVRGGLEVVRVCGGVEQVVERVGPGAAVGEGNLLTGAPAYATVRTHRDSTLLRLRPERFLSISERYPKILIELLTQLSTRHRRQAQREADFVGHRFESSQLTVALIPLSPGVLSDTRAALCAALSRLGTTACVDTDLVASRLGHRASAIDVGDPDEAQLMSDLARMTEQYDTVLFVTDGTDTPWTRRCARQADILLLVADAQDDPCLRPVERQLSQGAAQQRLVLVQPPSAQSGKDTAAWLDARSVSAHHHLRRGRADDADRCARLLTGRGYGVVFSGAATRGTAHLGLPRAMTALDIPVDMVAGNSAGAGIAAMVALGMPHEASMALARRVTREARPVWRDLVPPLVALQSGESYNRLLQDIFGEACLEDQFIPCLLTAVDLCTQQLVILDRGPAWKAVRASASAPMYWPPVADGGRVLIDGGVLTNLPIEPLLPSCRNGQIIASDLSTGSGAAPKLFTDCDDYGYAISGWKLLLDWLLPWRKTRRYPTAYEQILHSMCLTSYRHQATLAQLCDRPNVHVVSPPPGDHGLFGISDRQVQALEASLYETAITNLSGLPRPIQAHHAV
ncbi:MAG: cyclic nucleotide-binding and patatin-like phospholipase domain-containing protein [Myxococcota bacterium]